MPNKLLIRTRASKDLRDMAKQDAERILNAINALKSGLHGDVKKLTNHSPSYRLRVGNWRVLFEIEGTTIEIL